MEDPKLKVCPICQSEKEPTKIRKSPEFGKWILNCPECSGNSIRDLDHKIEIESQKGNGRRTGWYARELKKECNPSSILEIGPGNWRFFSTYENLKGGSSVRYTSIDVGNNFESTRDQWKDNKNFTNIIVDSPSGPDEIFDVSKKIYEMASNKIKDGEKIDFGVSLHSLEHAPDPVLFAKTLADFCKGFVIEVPEGGFSLNGMNKDFSHIKGNYNGPWPVTKTKFGQTVKVNGHYHWFTVDSLEIFVRLHFPPGVYYVGLGAYHHNGIVISTHQRFLRKGFKTVEIS